MNQVVVRKKTKQDFSEGWKIQTRFIRKCVDFIDAYLYILLLEPIIKGLFEVNKILKNSYLCSAFISDQ